MFLTLSGTKYKNLGEQVEYLTNVVNAMNEKLGWTIVENADGTITIKAENTNE